MAPQKIFVSNCVHYHYFFIKFRFDVTVDYNGNWLDVVMMYNREPTFETDPYPDMKYSTPDTEALDLLNACDDGSMLISAHGEEEEEEVNQNF